jgi:hypothetical protein
MASTSSLLLARDLLRIGVVGCGSERLTDFLLKRFLQ